MILLVCHNVWILKKITKKTPLSFETPLLPLLIWFYVFLPAIQSSHRLTFLYEEKSQTPGRSLAFAALYMDK